jgi:hypothetical protein
MRLVFALAFAGPTDARAKREGPVPEEPLEAIETGPWWASPEGVARLERDGAL